MALHSEAMDHHMGVFATTGMGKSNFMKVFAASCMRLSARGESKLGLLIAHPHGEYLKGKDLVKGLTHLKKYRDGLACYSTDEQNASDPGVEELTISESEHFRRILLCSMSGRRHKEMHWKPFPGSWTGQTGWRRSKARWVWPV